jgi:AraC family transcriptional regulator
MVLDRDYVLEQTRKGQTFVHNFQPGESQLLPSETSGFWRTRQSVELLHIQFSKQFLQTVAGKSGLIGSSDLEVADRFLLADPKVTHIAYALFAELAEGGSNGSLYSESLATALAIHLLRQYGTMPDIEKHRHHVSRSELNRALHYIHDNLGTNIALGTLAEIASLSPSHFNAVFKEEIGVPPHRYILHQRIHRAKELLLSSRLSVAQIAIEVGFYDQSHLTKHMRRLLGVTPAALQHQQNILNDR